MIIVKSIQSNGIVKLKVSREDWLSIIEELKAEIESPFTLFISVLVLTGITLTLISLGLLVWLIVLWKGDDKAIIKLVEEKTP